MACPLLRRSHPPACRGTDGAPAVRGEVISAFCRGSHLECPAYRFVRAAGRLVHPADFTRWVAQSVTPPGGATDAVGVRESAADRDPG